MLPTRPDLLRRLREFSAFYSEATEIEAKPNLSARPMIIQDNIDTGAKALMDTGVQALEASGRRHRDGGIGMDSEVNVEETLPPQTGPSRIFVGTRNLEVTQRIEDKMNLGYHSR